jgi:hypothetical protein
MQAARGEREERLQAWADAVLRDRPVPEIARALKAGRHDDVKAEPAQVCQHLFGNTFFFLAPPFWRHLFFPGTTVLPRHPLFPKAHGIVGIYILFIGIKYVGIVVEC